MKSDIKRKHERVSISLPSILELRVLAELYEGRTSAETARALETRESAISEVLRKKLPAHFALPESKRPVLSQVTGRVTALTPAGHKLAQAAVEVLARLKRAMDDTLAVHQGAEAVLRIAFIPAAMELLHGALPALRRARPSLRISLHEANAAEQEQALRWQTADLTLGYRIGPFLRSDDTASELVTVELQRLPLVVLVPAAEAKSLAKDPRGLSGRTLWTMPTEHAPVLAKQVPKMLEQLGIRCKLGSAPSARSQVAYVASGDGFCVLPKPLAELRWPGVSPLELPGFKLAIPLCAFHRRDDESPPLVELLSWLRRHRAQ